MRKATFLCLFAVLITVVPAVAQSSSDEAAIRKILEDGVATWNRGDADGYSRHFASDGTFTNVQGMFFAGYQAFRDRHEEIFKGQFRGTVLQQQPVSIRFVRPGVAVVDSLTWVSGFPQPGPPPGLRTDEKGRLRTRLFQLFVKDGADWKIAVYHNVDVKPAVSAPEPR